VPDTLALSPLPLVPATVERFQLGPATGPDPFTELAGTWRRRVDVPSDSARLVAELTDSGAADLDLWLGRDSNGDGLPEATEQVCQSLSGGWNELCDVLLPKAGSWWILVQNARGSGAGLDEVRLDWAVVPLSAGAPEVRLRWPPAGASEDHRYTVELTWSLPELKAGDRRYGAIGLSDDPLAPTRLGLIPVDLLGVDTPSTATPTPSPQPTNVPSTDIPARPQRVWLPWLKHDNPR
jgi:hypothetical protein